jgi:hypothetical protein
MLDELVEKRRADVAAKGVAPDPVQGGAVGRNLDIGIAGAPAADHAVPDPRGPPLPFATAPRAYFGKLLLLRAE